MDALWTRCGHVLQRLGTEGSELVQQGLLLAFVGGTMGLDIAAGLQGNFIAQYLQVRGRAARRIEGVLVLGHGQRLYPCDAKELLTDHAAHGQARKAEAT